MSDRAPYPAVLLYSFFPWRHEYPSTAHGLARALAAYTDVYFVSKPPTLKDAVFGKVDRGSGALPSVTRIPEAPRLRVVELPASLPINGLPAGGLYEVLRKRNDRRLNRALRTVLQAEGLQKFIWVNLYAPTQFVDLELHRTPESRVYYSVDAVAQAPYTAKHGIAAERVQVERADLVLATSSALLQHVRHLTPSAPRCALLPNAMNGDRYDAASSFAEPESLRAVPHPRAVYLGNLDAARIDFAGLQAFAKTRPDVHLVLAGPWNAGADARTALETLPNVHLLGRQAPEDCPAILAHGDLGLIPFLRTPLTAAIYPLKINEYLALGLPVLSTEFSADIAAFGDVITLAEVRDWPECVDAAIASRADDAATKARIARGRASTWDTRAVTFLELCAPAVAAVDKAQALC